MSYEFLLTSLIVVLLPGTGVVYTIAVGLGRGFQASVAAAAGCTLGIVPAALASILGLAAIFHTSAMAFLFIKYLGVVYLFYMAWNILRGDDMIKLDKSGHTEPGLRIAMRGALLNVLNPKLSLFFLAFLPQFVPPAQSGSLSYLLFLAAVFMVMTFVVFVIYGGFAAAARKHVIDSPGVQKWLKRVFAGAFGLLGLRLAFGDR